MESAALLARVSSKGQEANSSPDAQLQRGRAYCARKGYGVATERVEVFSGAFALARSVYNDLLNLAAEGQISVIVVDIPDRLGRGDTIAKLELLAQLNGARVEYAQPGRDTSTVEGLVQHSAEQMVSGIERLNIGRRCISGKYDWAHKGRIIATKQKPLGYEFLSERDARGRKVSCVLAVVPDEVPLVQCIYRLCAEECMTTRGIAKRLNQEQVPSPNGKLWQPSTIYNILTSETYKGTWRFGKVEQKRHDGWGHLTYTSKLRDASETVTVPCPAIVDVALWDAAQVQLERNRAKFVKPTVHTYLLRGRIHCQCKRTMAGTFARTPGGDETGRDEAKGYRYYECTRDRAIDTHPCHAKKLRAAHIENIVWEVVSGEMQNIDILIRKVKENQAKGAGARKRIKQAIVATQTLINKANARYDRAERLHLDGALSRERLDLYRAERDGDIAKLLLDRQKWEQQLVHHAELPPNFEHDLRELSRAMFGRLSPNTSPEHKLQAYELFQIECDYKSDTQQLTINGLMGSRTVFITICCGNALEWPAGPCR